MFPARRAAPPRHGAWILVLSACAAASCGRSGPGGLTSLGALTLSPPSVPFDEHGGPTQVSFSVEAAGALQDVTTFTATLRSTGGLQGLRIGGPVTHVGPGTLGGAFLVPTASATTYTVEVQVQGARGESSNAATATLPVRNPVPMLSSLSVTRGDPAGSVTMIVRGGEFVPTTYVEGDARRLATTYLDRTRLLVTFSPGGFYSFGEIRLRAVTPPPGGGSSDWLPFQVTRPATPEVAALPFVAWDAVWNPYRQRLYLSVPFHSATHPGTVVAVDPATGEVTGSSPILAGEPGRLALSDDGAFLYVGLWGDSSVKRLALPSLAPDLDIPLAGDATWGPVRAHWLAVAPGAPHTIATVLRPVRAPSTGAVAIFDDTVPRGSRVSVDDGFGAIAWDPTGSVLYGRRDTTLSVASVGAAGAVLTSTFPSAFGSPDAFDRSGLQFEPGTGLLYGDARAVSPADGTTAGSFATTGLYYPMTMLADASLGLAFVMGMVAGGTELRAYDLAGLASVGSTTIEKVPRWERLVRFGADGLVIQGSQEVVLVRGAAVLPPSATDNPVPAIAALAPDRVAAGGGNLRVRVTGSGFARGAVVRWGGSDRSTRFVSATELVAYVPASDVASAGAAALTVVNPPPGGGASGVATFTVD